MGKVRIQLVRHTMKSTYAAELRRMTQYPEAYTVGFAVAFYDENAKVVEANYIMPGARVNSLTIPVHTLPGGLSGLEAHLNFIANINQGEVTK